MKSIQSGIIPITNIEKELRAFFEKEYQFSSNVLDGQFRELLDKLKSDLWVYVEYPYVDKVYRNSYYNYYSSKNNFYDRDCVRLSFFREEILENDFFNSKKLSKLQETFLGFVVVRPTPPQMLGRSLVSPKAFKKYDISCCGVNVQALVNGVKLKVFGFPHSSQDAETITCAETTIWSVMEYFGNRYPEWKPVLPSSIISALSSYSYERQLPSHGLTPEQISFALKEFGFGVKLYSTYGEQEELRYLLHYYIDSGIPVIVTLTNDTIGHAVVYIGYENSSQISIKDINPTKTITTVRGNVNIIDTCDFRKNYVVIDDNFPPYELAEFDLPTQYYENKDNAFDGCKIDYLIVPLHAKIYLEALNAKEFIMSLFENGLVYCDIQKSVIFKLFLASSRSFKSEVASNEKLNSLVKELVIKSSMPKFIWIAELSHKELYEEGEIFGFIIVDATETSRNLLDALILIACPNEIYTYENRMFKKREIDFDSFSMFSNNLTNQNI